MLIRDKPVDNLNWPIETFLPWYVKLIIILGTFGDGSNGNVSLNVYVSLVARNLLVAVDRVYRSKRLIFRAVEHNDEDKKTSKYSEWMVEQMAKSVLSVMVCLLADTSGDGDEEVDEAKTAVLKPIGYLAIGWGGIPLVMAYYRSYQGKGYGTEVINWALDWAFRYGNYHRRAQYLYKKLGFIMKVNGR
ncbi:hypothetical protein CCUS01_03415 [Colletotrichum cuscutae]|uniref:N-acetyltransferase domain-containing protein n=1 Tax=Colletotrichum cuscutae TaxID=1209917 RepID=A0AAJ0DKE4_9PEZI|nr:hypothetical protein CCUS01_03415 [Colletotrichum cuscutae]